MKILLATDGSDYSKEAVSQINELLEFIENPVVRLVTVVDYTVDAASEPFISSAEFLEKVEGAMRMRSEAILSAAEASLLERHKDLPIQKWTLVGSAKKLIVKEAADWNAELIVVGSHGYGVVARTFLGSVSDAIVHHANCSVFIARKKSSDAEEV